MNGKANGNVHFIIINLMIIRINGRLHFPPSIFVIYEVNLMIICINGPDFTPSIFVIYKINLRILTGIHLTTILRLGEVDEVKTPFLPIFLAHSGIISPRVSKNSRSFGGKRLKYSSRSPQVYL